MGYAPYPFFSYRPMARKPKENIEKLSQEVQQEVSELVKKNTEALNREAQQEVPEYVKEAFKVFPDQKELYLTPKGIYLAPHGDAKLYKNPFINE